MVEFDCRGQYQNKRLHKIIITSQHSNINECLRRAHYAALSEQSSMSSGLESCKFRLASCDASPAFPRTEALDVVFRQSIRTFIVPVTVFLFDKAAK